MIKLITKPGLVSRQSLRRQRSFVEYECSIGRYDDQCGEVITRPATDREKAYYDRIIRNRPMPPQSEVKHADTDNES